MRSRNPRFNPSDLDDEEKLKQSRRKGSDSGSPGLIPMPKKWTKERSTPITKKPPKQNDNQRNSDSPLNLSGSEENTDDKEKQVVGGV